MIGTIIASAATSYITHGVTTGDWTSSKAFKAMGIGAAAGLVGFGIGAGVAAGASAAASALGAAANTAATIGVYAGGIIGGAAGGATGGALNAWDKGLTGSDFWKLVGLSAGFGAMLGGIFGGNYDLASYGTWSYGEILGWSIAGSFYGGALGAGWGAVISFGWGLLRTCIGDWHCDLEKAWQDALLGIQIGGITGALLGGTIAGSLIGSFSQRSPIGWNLGDFFNGRLGFSGGYDLFANSSTIGGILGGAMGLATGATVGIVISGPVSALRNSSKIHNDSVSNPDQNSTRISNIFNNYYSPIWKMNSQEQRSRKELGRLLALSQTPRYFE